MVVFGSVGCRPAVRQEPVEFIERCGRQAGEHVAQVGERIDAVPPTGGDETEENRARVPAVVGTAEDPVLTIMQSSA